MSRPHFGAFKLPGGPQDVGKRCDALERWLRDLYVLLKPEGGISHFFYEAQHVTGNVNMDVLYLLIGLGATVDKFAYQTRGLAYRTGIQEWRKHFIGRGTGFKRGPNKQYLPGQDPKELAIQRCADYGWHTDVHDAGEACGILDYSLSLIPEYHRPWRDKVLMGGA